MAKVTPLFFAKSDFSGRIFACCYCVETNIIVKRWTKGHVLLSFEILQIVLIKMISSLEWVFSKEIPPQLSIIFQFRLISLGYVTLRKSHIWIHVCWQIIFKLGLKWGTFSNLASDCLCLCCQRRPDMNPSIPNESALKLTMITECRIHHYLSRLGWDHYEPELSLRLVISCRFICGFIPEVYSAQTSAAGNSVWSAYYSFKMI